MRYQYRDLYFGKSDSLNEANERQDDFVRSYVDLDGAAESVLGGRIFLVLGPKGTGKSALAWYLRAIEGPESHLVLVRNATSLPLDEIPNVQTGQTPGPARTVIAWKFILLCNYLELLLRDEMCSLHDDPEVVRVAKLLRDYGFMGDTSGRALLKASTTTITIPIPKLGTIYKRESTPHLKIYNLVPYLEAWVTEASSTIRHVLLLDGLDSILLNDTKFDESLSSLVQAAYVLNQRMRSQPATGSIVLLLRNDVFARISLSLPDSQKMRDDLSLELDWRVMSGSAGARAPLFQLVNAKAGRALGVDSIEVLDYFPPHIVLGRDTDNPRYMPVLQYLLNLTRHTPRDMLRLFEEIRKVIEMDIYKPREDGRLSQEAIREGVLRYSMRYFVDAVRNEFAGFEGGPERSAQAISALKHIGRQTFNRDDFTEALVEVGGSSADVNRLLTLLFYAGAIGNRVHRGRSDGRYMQFYHRRNESDIYLKGEFKLHNALIHAWGMFHDG